MSGAVSLLAVLANRERIGKVGDDWLRNLAQASTLGSSGRISAEDLARQAREFLELLAAALRHDDLDITADAWSRVRTFLESVSRSRAVQGYTSVETATFVMSLKKPLFDQLSIEAGDNAARLGAEAWATTRLLDALALHTVQTYQQAREDIIRRQQEEMLELSTPVVKLWDGILALPMVGTLDSARTQVVMESLLNQIVATGAQIAILDITGVPTVDTLVAQHLLKTVTALRLMGAECIISGVRPQIAQTIVHLGIDLQGVTTRANLADALALALKRTGATLAR